MDLPRPQIHALMLYDFKSELNAAESSRRINSTNEKDNMSERTARG